MSLIENGLFIAVIAHALLGVSLVWDKILLGQPKLGDVVNYVFWLGALHALVCR